MSEILEYSPGIVGRPCGFCAIISRVDPNADYIKSYVVPTISMRCPYEDRAMLPAMYTIYTGYGFAFYSKFVIQTMNLFSKPHQ